MIIAVTYDNNNVFQHFGHTEYFKIYKINDNKIVDKSVVSTNGQGHGALATFLKNNNVDVVICGGIGSGAQNALNSNGINFYGGVSGNCDDAVSALLNNKLEYNPNVMCNHHDHDENHTCGSHGCGEHKKLKRNI